MHSLKPPRLSISLAALALALLACDMSSVPIPQTTYIPPGPTATRRLPGTSLPDSTSTAEPIDGSPLPPDDSPAGTAGPTLAPTFTSPPGDLAEVTHIVDGDTIHATQNGQDVTIRYIGINTPEVGQPCADKATAANNGLVAGQMVTLVKDVSDTDQYGRLLRYVYSGGIMVNAELVRQGWAEAVKYPPDVAHADEFHTLALSARAANLGCWPTGLFGPPAPTSSAPTVTPGGPTPTAGTPSTIAVCDCDFNKYNCSSFASRADAQACFDYCVAQGAGDIHLLDGNANGLACENIP